MTRVVEPSEPTCMIWSFRLSSRSEDSAQLGVPRTSTERRAASLRWARRRAIRRSVLVRSTMAVLPCGRDDPRSPYDAKVGGGRPGLGSDATDARQFARAQ